MSFWTKNLLSNAPWHFHVSVNFRSMFVSYNISHFNCTFKNSSNGIASCNGQNDIYNKLYIKKYTKLRLLTHVGFIRQNGLILSEVFLYMERSKNQEKKYIITVQKNFTFLRRFDRKNTVLGISRNLIDKFVLK